MWRGASPFALFRSRRRAWQRDAGGEEASRRPTCLESAIQDLEEELGVKLLERSTRGIKLTEAGKFFADEAGAMLERAYQALKAVRALARGETQCHASPHGTNACKPEQISSGLPR